MRHSVGSTATCRATRPSLANGHVLEAARPERAASDRPAVSRLLTTSLVGRHGAALEEHRRLPRTPTPQNLPSQAVLRSLPAAVDPAARRVALPTPPCLPRPRSSQGP